MKHWESEEGSNVLASFLTAPPPRTSDLPALNMATSLALKACLQHFNIHGVEIKWPNDLLIGRSKIAGILIENVLEGDRIKYSIIGVGLNVNQKYFPKFQACSMQSISGKSFDRDEVLKVLYDRLYHYLVWPLDSLLEEINKALFAKGSYESFTNSEQDFKAKVLKMNDKGNLVVEHDSQMLELAHHQTKWIL